MSAPGCPGLPCAARPDSPSDPHRRSRNQPQYIFLANFLGQPAVTVPVGVDAANHDMPVGLQFLAAHWSEHNLLRLARAAQLGAPPMAPPADYVDVLAE